MALNTFMRTQISKNSLPWQRAKLMLKYQAKKTRSRIRPIHKKLSLKAHAFSYIGIFIDWMIENFSNMSFSHLIKNIVVNEF